MLPSGKSRRALIAIIVLLTLNLCVCGMFSYRGSDVPVIGPRGSITAESTSSGSSGGFFFGGSSIRSGSTGSRSTFGGGSSSGK